MIAELQKTIDDLNLKNVTIKKGKKGLTISIENIQFEPDSPVLMDSEKAKLDKISEILTQFPNDLLITGHCADRGTAEARQKLSEERAETVAEYLKKKGVRDEYHIFTFALVYFIGEAAQKNFKLFGYILFAILVTVIIVLIIRHIIKKRKMK